MTLSCAGTRGLFASYLDEAVSREERCAVRAHLVECDACRREAAGVDPALLFAAMPAEEVPAGEAERILAAVRSGIALKTAERRIALGTPRRRAGMTAAAVAAAVIVGLTTAPRPRPAQVEVPLAATAPGAAGRSLAGFAPAGGPSFADRPLTPLSPFSETSGPDASKGKLPADATIYDWNPGGGQTRVVWIVDRSLDI
jgi:hypothetical protein